MNDELPPAATRDPEWPHGCRCGKCNKIITEDLKMGLFDRMADNDIPIYMVVCAECWTSAEEDKS